jgi:hypothetical protein
MLELTDLIMQYNFCARKELLQVYISGLCLLYKLFPFPRDTRVMALTMSPCYDGICSATDPTDHRQEWDSGLKDHNAS